MKCLKYSVFLVIYLAALSFAEEEQELSEASDKKTTKRGIGYGLGYGYGGLGYGHGYGYGHYPAHSTYYTYTPIYYKGYGLGHDYYGGVGHGYYPYFSSGYHGYGGYGGYHHGWW